MKVNFIIILIVISFIITSESYPYNSTSSVISKYARVAVWGSNDTTARAARGNRGNILNHRLSPKSIPSTTRKKDPQVAYQYPVYGPQPTKNRTTEFVPGIGEVVVAQDRFEARPLFAYKNKLQTGAGGYSYNVPAGPSLSLKTTTTTTTTTTSAPSGGDPYDSPYSSYNPPGDMYPPIKNSDPKGNKGPQTDIPYPSLGPPLAAMDDDNKNMDANSYDASDSYEEPPNHKQEDQPPNPPKSIDDIYYPPDFPKDSHNEDPMSDMKDDSMTSNDYHHPEDTMVRAPAPPAYDEQHSFPSYLFNHHHYDNHVYEEIPHTTEMAKEDKRVSSTNYSYYYLGRKLWYIPLYFSIYFIIYVTVLILKSIARHKVRLKYKWYEHDTSAKQARSIDLSGPLVSDLHHNVLKALNKTASKYDRVKVPK